MKQICPVTEADCVRECVQICRNYCNGKAAPIRVVDPNEMVRRINEGPAARAALLDEFLRVSIPIQIRMLREDRKWTQLELARRCKMTQSRIAQLETIGAPLPSIKTLQRIAAACDVGFVCRFTSWSEFVKFAAAYADHIPSFADDPGCER